MANASYDTLTITINADSKQANASISRLNTNLKKLDKTAQELNIERINEVKTLLLDIASIDFSNVSKGLQDVVSAFRSFSNKAFMRATQNATNLTQAPNFELVGDPYVKVENALAPLQDRFEGLRYQIDIVRDSFKEAFGNNTQKEIEDTQDIFERLEQEMQKAGFNAEQIKSVFASIKTESKVFNAEELEKFRKILESLGIPAKEIERVMKHLKTEVKEVEKNTTLASRGFARMFINILKYRVVRKVIQEVFSQMQTAIQQLALEDDSFNEAMTTIKSSITYVARALVSVVAPIIKAVAPIIEAIAQSIGEIANEMAKTLAWGFGQDTFATAKESVDDYAESLKKAKSITLGIDELNVVSGEEDKDLFGGNTLDQTSEVSGFVKDIVSEIRSITSDLMPQLAPIFKNIVKIVKSVLPIIQKIIKFVDDIISLTDDGVNEMVNSTLVMIESIVSLLDTTLPVLIPFAVAGIKDIMILLNAINRIIAFSNLAFATSVKLVNTIVKVLVDLFNFDFGGILKDFTSFFKDIGTMWNDFYKSIWNMFAKVWNAIQDTIIGGLNWAIRQYNKVAGALNLPKLKELTGGLYADIQSYDHIGSTSNDSGSNPIFDLGNILSGLQGQGQGDIVINLDGREMARVLTKRQDNFGANLMSGGNLNYGK